jgi:hypothetical protein
LQLKFLSQATQLYSLATNTDDEDDDGETTVTMFE